MPTEPDHQPSERPEEQPTLQTLADEVDDAVARCLIDPEAGAKLYRVLGTLAEQHGDNAAPVEPEGVAFFRGIMQSLLRLRVYDPGEAEEEA